VLSAQFLTDSDKLTMKNRNSLSQWDQTLSEKSAQFCQKIPQIGALIYKDFYPNELHIKIWNFKGKRLPKSRTYLSNFGQ
jgi:hypothetical protein